MDIACVVTAYFMAGKDGNQWELIGIGTVIMAFGTGPLLAFFKERIAQPFVEKMCGELPQKKNGAQERWENKRNGKV